MPFHSNRASLAIQGSLSLVLSIAVCACGDNGRTNSLGDAGPGGAQDASPGGDAPSPPDASIDPPPDPPPDAPPDAPPAPPSARIVFPPPRGVTDGATIVLRGTANATTTAVRVNGATAVTADAFAHWTVELALAPGSNTLAVEAEDGAGHTTAGGSVVVIRKSLAMLEAPSAIAIEPNGARVFVADTHRRAIIAVDRATGARTVISDAATGSGPLLEEPVVLAFNTKTGDLLVGERAAKRVDAIDIATGNRRVVSSFIAPTGLVYDAATDRALAMDGITDSLVSIDLATGAQTLVSQEGRRGTGFRLFFGRGLALDATNRRAFIRIGDQPPTTGIVSVDLATGDRTVVTRTFDVGGGSTLFDSRDIVYDAERNRLITANVIRAVAVDLANGNRTDYIATPSLLTTDVLALQAGRLVVLDRERDALLDLDVVTGAGTTLIDRDFGEGVALTEPRDVFLDGDRAIVINNTLFDNTVVAIDPVTSNRVPLSPRPGGAPFPPATDFLFPADLAPSIPGHALVTNSSSIIDVDLIGGGRKLVIGSGPELSAPFAVTVDPVAQQAFVADAALDAILRVDLATGNRTQLAPLSAISLGAIGDLARDQAGRLLFVDDQHAAVLAIDAVTGTSSVVSDATHGTGPVLSGPRAIAYDRARDRAIVGDGSSLVAIDTATGNRGVVASGFVAPRSLAVDGSERAFVTDARSPNTALLFAVDLVTGARVVISGR